MPKRRRPNPDPPESVLATLPERVPVMPIKSTILFPTGATGLQVGFAPNVEVLSRYRERNLVVALVHAEDDEMPIDPASLQKIGVLSRVLNRLNLPGGTIQTTIQGLIRVHLEDVRFEDGHYTASTRLVEEVAIDEEEAKRLIEKILATLGGIGANVERLAEVPKILRSNMGDPGRFADLVATLSHFGAMDKNEVLQRLDVAERLEYVVQALEREWERFRSQSQAGDEHLPPSGGSGDRPGDRAGEIRKRIATLQSELSELDPAEKETLEALRQIERTQLPSNVSSVARREAERLRTVPPGSPDASAIRHHLDLLLSLPWSTCSTKTEIDLDGVRSELDAHHLGLEEVKRKILEFLSVAKLRGNIRGPVPCIVGPPYVGKRTLVEAIAEGLGRPLLRLELGGRGEAQLLGSRRARNGARPGKIIEAYRGLGIRDPVFLLEELDLIGLGNVEGDPIEAMEEVLDPETRPHFIDRYLDVTFDLSDTLFIVTANDFYRVPRNLREFLIEIRIAGYTSEEKVEIAREQLLPRLAGEHGLAEDDVDVVDDTLLLLTRGYARDSGLGNLRRSLSSILRYVAHEKARETADHWEVTPELVEEVLGTPRYSTTEAESAPEVGVVTGLAWTASGGELMFIEALKMPGSGRLIITGLLGDVMKESVSAAYSYVRSRAEMLGIPIEVFPEHDIHIHFPVGATPKDGPSAGAAVTLAIASSLSDRSVRHDIALTGEVTLRGKVLEIGGVKEKILAAYRAGLREVILPAGNERDLRDVPDDVRAGTEFLFVEHMDQVFERALDPKQDSIPKKDGRRKTGGGSKPEGERKRRKVAATESDSSGG
ncbi:MAG: endopeptidase La [Gemmatimonas sp.]|nr:endopeptidase La [Gemmatimonas sp.]